jgi:hypothetical protein
MKPLDPAAMMADLNREAKASVEKQISDRIKHEFPEIIQFTVNFDIKNNKVNITGLTEEQVAQIL